MLTPEQLDDYKRVTLAAIVGPTKQAESKFENMAYAMVPALIEEVERLQLALKAKDAVLAQFSDKENWEYEPAQYGPEGRKELPCEWYWINVLSPQDLANQALNEGHE